MFCSKMVFHKTLSTSNDCNAKRFVNLHLPWRHRSNPHTHSQLFILIIYKLNHNDDAFTWRTGLCVMCTFVTAERRFIPIALSSLHCTPHRSSSRGGAGCTLGRCCGPPTITSVHSTASLVVFQLGTTLPTLTIIIIQSDQHGRWLGVGG